MKLRQSDLDRARDDRHRNPYLDTDHRPAELLAHYERRADELGLHKIHKPRLRPRWFRRSTAWATAVFLGYNFARKHDRDKAGTWAEEFCHVLQIREEGEARFVARYIADARFRWAVEVQAKREVVRAYRSMGWRGDMLESVVEAQAQNVCKNYGLWFLRGKKAATRQLLREAVGLG